MMIPRMHDERNAFYGFRSCNSGHIDLDWLPSTCEFVDNGRMNSWAHDRCWWNALYDSPPFCMKAHWCSCLTKAGHMSDCLQHTHQIIHLSMWRCSHSGSHQWMCKEHGKKTMLIRRGRCRPGGIRGEAGHKAGDAFQYQVQLWPRPVLDKLKLSISYREQLCWDLKVFWIRLCLAAHV